MISWLQSYFWKLLEVTVEHLKLNNQVSDVKETQNEMRTEETWNMGHILINIVKTYTLHIHIWAPAQTYTVRIGQPCKRTTISYPFPQHVQSGMREGTRWKICDICKVYKMNAISMGSSLIFVDNKLTSGCALSFSRSAVLPHCDPPENFLDVEQLWNCITWQFLTRWINENRTTDQPTHQFNANLLNVQI